MLDIDRHMVRQLLARAFLNDADLDAFLGDFFTSTHRRAASAMSTVQKVNLLLDYNEPTEIAGAVANHYDDDKQKLRALVREFPWLSHYYDVTQRASSYEEMIPSVPDALNPPQFADAIRRNSLQERLEEILKTRPIASVEGIAGSGKTWLVANTVAGMYTKIIWHEPQSNEPIGVLFAVLSEFIKLSGATIAARCRELVQCLKKYNACLVLDGFHQAEQSSYMTLLTAVTGSGLPGRIILTSHMFVDMPRAPSSIGHLEVVGFSSEELDHIFARRGSEPLSQTIRDALIEKTDGLPLAIEMYITLVQHLGFNPEELLLGNAFRDLQEWFGKVISRISAAEREVLQRLSLIDVPFNRGMLRDLCDDILAEDSMTIDSYATLQSLRRYYLISKYSRYRWQVHKLISTFSVQVVSDEFAQKIHERIAQHYANGISMHPSSVVRQDQINQLVYAYVHFCKADNRTEASRVLLVMASSVKALGHCDLFIKYAGSGRNLASDKNRWIDYHLAHCYYIVGKIQESERTIEPLRYHSSDPKLRASANRLYAEILGSSGKPTEGLKVLQNLRLNRAFRKKEPQIWQHIRSTEIWLHTEAGNYQEANRLCAQLSEQTYRARNRRAIAVLITRQAVLYLAQDKLDRAARDLETAMGLFEECRDHRGATWALSYLAVTVARLRRLEQAKRLSCRLVANITQIGNWSIDLRRNLEALAMLLSPAQDVSHISSILVAYPRFG